MILLFFKNWLKVILIVSLLILICMIPVYILVEFGLGIGMGALFTLLTGLFALALTVEGSDYE